jgi:hypothetical protein
MKGFGIIGMAAIAGLIGYFCEPALRSVLTPEAKTPAKPIAPPAVAEPAPEKPVPPVVTEPEPPKTEPQAEPATEPTPPMEEPAPVAPEPAPVAEPEVPSEPETPAEPVPAQPEETKPEESVPAPSGKMELPPVKPLALEPPTPITPLEEVAESSPVIVAMQESFQNDGLKEFTEATPTRWQAGTDETVGGETYQTGLLDYLAQTPFGGKAMQVKALLQDGKVVKWVSVTSGKELR